MTIAPGAHSFKRSCILFNRLDLMQPWNVTAFGENVINLYIVHSICF